MISKNTLAMPAIGHSIPKLIPFSTILPIKNTIFFCYECASICIMKYKGRSDIDNDQFLEMFICILCARSSINKTYYKYNVCMPH